MLPLLLHKFSAHLSFFVISDHTHTDACVGVWSNACVSVCVRSSMAPRAPAHTTTASVRFKIVLLIGHGIQRDLPPRLYFIVLSVQ